MAEAGARVWIDEGELRIGDSIIERIATAIADVHFVVAIVSIQSNWCQRELSLAISGGLNRDGVKVSPLRLGDVAMPATLTAEMGPARRRPGSDDDVALVAEL